MPAKAGEASYGFHPIAWGGASVFLAGSRLHRGPLEDRQEITLQSKTE